MIKHPGSGLRLLFLIGALVQTLDVRAQKAAEFSMRPQMLHTKSLVDEAMFSNDGSMLVTAGLEGTVELWHVKTGAKYKVLKGFKNPVRSVAFSQDGKQVIGADDHGIVRVWNAVTGSQLNNCRVCPDIRNIRFSASEGKAIIDCLLNSQLIDIATGAVEHQFKGGDPQESPDGQTILTHEHCCRTHLWSARTGSEVRHFETPGTAIRFAVFSPNGRQILTGGNDKAARLWDVDSGAEALRFEGHRQTVSAACFSSDATHIVTSTSYESFVWNSQTGGRQASINSEGIFKTVHCGTAGRTVVVSFQANGSPAMFDAMTGLIMRLFGADGEAVTAMSNDHRWILTVDRNAKPSLWDGLKLIHSSNAKY